MAQIRIMTRSRIKIRIRIRARLVLGLVGGELVVWLMEPSVSVIFAENDALYGWQSTSPQVNLLGFRLGLQLLLALGLG